MDEEKRLPEHFREVSIGTMTHTIRLRSTFVHESLDVLIDRAIGMIEHLKKVDKE